MIFSIGNLQNYLKNQDLQRKWQRKKDDPLQAQLEHLKIKRLFDPQPAWSVETINAKLAAGKKLTSAELAYLKENHPELYDKAVRIARERAEYERELRKCRTKEDVRRLHMGKTASFLSQMKEASSTGGSQSVSDIGMHAASISDAHMVFTGTKEYKRLPEDYRELKERQKEKEGRRGGAGAVFVPSLPIDALLYDANARKKQDALSALRRAAAPPESAAPAGEAPAYGADDLTSYLSRQAMFVSGDTAGTGTRRPYGVSRKEREL